MIGGGRITGAADSLPDFDFQISGFNASFSADQALIFMYCPNAAHATEILARANGTLQIIIDGTVYAGAPLERVRDRFSDLVLIGQDTAYTPPASVAHTENRSAVYRLSDSNLGASFSQVRLPFDPGVNVGDDLTVDDLPLTVQHLTAYQLGQLSLMEIMGD